ncbi:MAG TPA: PKD domain-containing protein, partial [Candidatus Nitrosocosmicus sp.]|nr:PKD domain-containing protein [Candidatus Nitrosocosmicus sp.]
FTNELQAVYLSKKSGVDDGKQFIINEFKDTDIIYSMKDSFSKEKCRYIRNIVETIYEDFCFYVVCNICSGPTLETYLSSNNLRLTEKMYLTESLLTQLIDMENLNPFIVFSLCDTENITVANKRNICFNCNLKLTAEKMSASKTDVSKQVGEIIGAIFSNTLATDLNYIKDNTPPALFSIVQSCLDGKYESMAKAYSDFKSLLLYSVFMGNGSVDTQMRKNLKKAKIKRRLTPVRRLAAIVIILLLAGGIWNYVKDLDIYTSNKGNTAVQNTKPAAQFTANKDQVFEGETVFFISQASDSDSNDSVKSYSWMITMDTKQVFDSSNQNIAYKFSKAGKYVISLLVADTHDEKSEPCQTSINVLPKPIVPSTGSDSGNNK